MRLYHMRCALSTRKTPSSWQVVDEVFHPAVACVWGNSCSFHDEHESLTGFYHPNFDKSEVVLRASLWDSIHFET